MPKLTSPAAARTLGVRIVACVASFAINAMMEEEGVRLPGERRTQCTARAREEGIEVSAELLEQLKRLAGGTA